MKILLVSDSHGYDDELKKVLENVKCEVNIHCGDSCFDKNSNFLKAFSIIVDGNHDQGYFPIYNTLQTPLGSILITHGHKFDVYAGYDCLVDYMNKNNISVGNSTLALLINLNQITLLLYQCIGNTY